MKKNKNKKLDLPFLSKEKTPHSVRSVDEINEWIEHDYKLFFNRKIYEKEKKKLSVNTPFKL
jgi:hypothetical protein